MMGSRLLFVTKGVLAALNPVSRNEVLMILKIPLHAPTPDTFSELSGNYINFGRVYIMNLD